MRSSRTTAWAVALVVGVIAAGVKLVYSFLPWFNLLDLVTFALLGWLSARLSESRGWQLWAALSGPAFLLSLFFVVRLGPALLLQGVGTGWAMSLMLIPLSTVIGMYASGRMDLA